MKTGFHRALALLLSLCMALSLCVPAMAAENCTIAQPDILFGTFYFDPHEGGVEIGDLPDTYIYSDTYFRTSSGKANAHLATMSMQLAAASISSCSYDRSEGAYATRSRNVTDLLTQLGFEEPAVNESYNQKMSEDTMGVAVAYKSLDQDTVLLAIVPRSAGYESEWSGNFDIGTEADGLHAGFKTGRDIALDFAKAYVAEHTSAFSGKTLKVWTVGYSRGAGVANLIGAAVADGYDFRADGSRTKIMASPENVYAYTFGTPATVQPQDDLDPHGDTYAGIHNYYAAYDPIAMLPFAAWGFTRYGQDTLLPTGSADAKTQMLSFLHKINTNVYNKYTKEGGDPDTFTAVQVDWSTLSLTPDTDAGLTQETFFQQRIAYLTKYLVPDTDTYVSGGYQDLLRTLMVLKFGGDGNDMSRLIARIQSEDHRQEALLAAGSLVIYAMVQDYADQYGADTVLDIDALSQQLEQIISQAGKLLQDAGINLPTDDAAEPDGGTVQEITCGELAGIFCKEAVKYVKALLDTCVAEAGFTNPETADLANRLTDTDEFVLPFVKFISAIAFGTELSAAQKEAADLPQILQLSLNTAATLYSNSGKYMRVHNNEVILSWVRTMDSNYTTSASANALAALAAISGGASAVSYGTFTDLSYNAWYRSGVEYMLDKGLMDGVSDSVFAPDDAISRAMVVTILWRLSGSPVVSYAIPFSDVGEDEWYSEAVRWAAGEGIVKGYSKKLFGTNDTITREQLATMLSRYAASQGADVSVNDTAVLDRFHDVQSVSNWALSSMQWAIEEGILKGTDGNLMPQNTATRAQAAVMIQRFCELAQ